MGPGSAKTRVLEVAQHLVRAPEMTISATTAALFRMVSDGPITILFDEVDTIFTGKCGNNEDLRGLLNAGYKCSATVARCVGDAKAMKVDRFKVYAPAALAGIAGNMPATITTRAISIHMQRRREDEEVEEFWEEATPLRGMLATWVGSVTDKISRGRPPMPEGVRDRAAEIWRPLIAIADADRNGGGQRLQLLADLRDLFAARGTDKLTTAETLTALHGLEESDWADLDGKPLDARRLAKMLKPYGVESRSINQPNGSVVKGLPHHRPGGLADAWQRYLPAATTTATSQANAVAVTRQVAQVAEVADNPNPQRTPKEAPWFLPHHHKHDHGERQTAWPPRTRSASSPRHSPSSPKLSPPKKPGPPPSRPDRFQNGCC